MSAAAEKGAMLCPCCRQALPPPAAELLVDAGSRTVMRLGEFAELTRQEFLLLAMLREAAPQFCSKAALLDRVALRRAAGGAAASQMRAVDVLVCTLRKKLEPLGAGIDTLWGSGYRLALFDPAADDNMRGEAG